ncbi:hypothetical protein CCP3SC5AM1_730015 [Gammaproteobacteria bacterium]
MPQLRLQRQPPPAQTPGLAQRQLPVQINLYEACNIARLPWCLTALCAVRYPSPA